MKLKNRIRTALSTALVIAGVGLCVSSQARPIEQIRKAGTLVVATEGQFSPFNYFEGAKLSGFEIDIAEALAAKMGLKV